MESITVWVREGDETPLDISVLGPRALADLRENSDLENSDLENSDLKNIVIAPGRGGDGQPLAILLVGEGLGHSVRCNGEGLAAGVNLLDHSDLIELGDGFGLSFWISTDVAVEEVEYDPTTHGTDLFCCRTRARIAAGERIVICPGAPKSSCGMVYKSGSWNAGIACHQCGRHPDQPRWTPPLEPERSSLRDLLRLVSR